ncbi:MAG: hypothetical protein ACK5Q5_03055 [Planctomycetaceae bacterium]
MPIGSIMSLTHEFSAATTSSRDAVVEPAVYAEWLLSREAMERVQVPDSDLLGLRNVRTGETLYVRGSGLQRWLQTGR